MHHLTFDSLVSPAVWVALAAGAVVLLAWYARRRPTIVTPRRWVMIIALMTIAIALVLVVLLNPTWVEPAEPIAGKPLATILVDASSSMAVSDVPGHANRYQAAAQAMQAIAGPLRSRFDVRVMTFTDCGRLTPLEQIADTKPEGQTTDLAAAVAHGLDDGRPQGQLIILLSDGIQTRGGGSAAVASAARQARAMSAPIFTQTFGGAAGGVDLALTVRNPQEVGYAGQAVEIIAQASQRGLTGGPASVALWSDGREIARQSATLTAGETTVRFNVNPPTTGLYRYELRAEAFPGELAMINNSATCIVRVIDEPIRVLMLEGKPYWDAKFLLRTLAFDPAVALDGAVRLGEGRVIKRTLAPATRPSSAASMPERSAESWTILTDASALLRDPEMLQRYQIVVLGRDAEAFLGDESLTNIRNWVARGGGALVCYRGAPVSEVTQRLAALLPVRWMRTSESRFHMHVTPAGRELPWLELSEPSGGDQPMAGLPTLATSARVEVAKPLSVVLASATAVGPEIGRVGAGNASSQDASTVRPVVTYQPYGSGRVVVIEGAGMWRWAFLPPKDQEGQDVYREMWQRLMRWLAAGAGLAPGQSVSLRADKVSFAVGEPVTATLLAREEMLKGSAPQVRLEPEMPSAGATRPSIEAPHATTFASVASGDEPGAFRVAFGALPEGRYRATVVATAGQSSAAAAFDVRRIGQEHLDLDARPELMQRLANESGGAVLTAEDPASEVIRRFDAAQERAAQARPARRVTAWDRWWLLIAALGLWTTSWALRRMSGLV